MRFVKLVSSYYLDPAVAPLTDAAEVAFTRSIAYCGAAESGGFIPADVLPGLMRRYTAARGRKVADQLVAHRLWIPVEGGWRLRTWAKTQEELERLLSRRRSDADRQARKRQRDRDQAPPLEPPESRDHDRDLSRDTTRDASRNSLSRAPGRETRDREEQTPVVTLVCRRLSGGTRETTTTGELELWQQALGPGDLEGELRAWLMHNADTDLRDPGAALLGWLREARRRHAPNRPTPIPDRPRCPLHPQHETGSRTCPECVNEATPAPNLRALRGAR